MQRWICYEAAEAPLRYSLHTRDVQHVGQSGPVDIQQLEEKHDEKQLKTIKSNLKCSISADEIMFNLMAKKHFSCSCPLH